MNQTKMLRRSTAFARGPRATPTAVLLGDHFGRTSLDDLTISSRQFPARVRVDLQRAVDGLLAGGGDGGGGDGAARVIYFCGVRQTYPSHDGLDFTSLLTTDQHNPAVVVPPRYEDVDVGDEAPARVLDVGLWLLETAGARWAVAQAPAMKYGELTGVRFQVATTNDDAGAELARDFFARLERAVAAAGTYRGKVLSLEQRDPYRGRTTAIAVHRLRQVARDQVILPRRTLELLERNVIGFAARRAALGRAGLSTKKGLLFYGPPGTGKTHTIHYLASALPAHTTLLVTAEQVGLLDEYVQLARLLQPSMVVIEDVDLIARDRDATHGPCAEVMLNKLLNEMDGLREDADVLFVLTTNRPQALEAALAARPGRVDQAIEFPLPDDEGRAKLVRLYARGAAVGDDVVADAVARTAGASAAFIKELLRRALQFHLERDESRPAIDRADVEAALGEMVFAGGTLNLALLGATGVQAGEGELTAGARRR